MKHVINTSDEPGVISSVMPPGEYHKGETIVVHRPSEHPDCGDCAHYLRVEGKWPAKSQ